MRPTSKVGSTAHLKNEPPFDQPSSPLKRSFVGPPLPTLSLRAAHLRMLVSIRLATPTTSKPLRYASTMDGATTDRHLGAQRGAQAEFNNEPIRRILCFSGAPCPVLRCRVVSSALAEADERLFRPISARAALHAWTGPEVARKAWPGRANDAAMKR
jgi:hypothetical protein